MSKRALIAAALIYVSWAVLDYLIHGVLLQDAYAATAALWRPMAEMKMGLIYFANAVAALVFTLIYDRFFARKGMGTAVAYGLLWGLAVGVPMAYGSYAVMPLPYSMALTWFLGSVVEAVLAGVILGALVKGAAAEAGTPA